MPKLTRQDLWSLEHYSEKRPQFRQQVMEHKRNRLLALGDNAVLYFEDETTIRYQIQEMLRIEKVFEAEGIQEELNAYNPLIPDGMNWKATFMLQYDDPSVRADKTRKLIGIEKAVWVQVSDFDKVSPICNEDLERDNGEKTSTVHFMRFELTPAMISAIKQGANIRAGIDHSDYRCDVAIGGGLRESLINDLSA